jgi:hypothetical protein
MSGDGEMKKSLTKWLTKAKTMPAPPEATEHRRHVPDGDVARTRTHEAIRQLNLKIPDSTYRKIKALAYRDRVSLVAMLDEMVELYEEARGKLEGGG